MHCCGPKEENCLSLQEKRNYSELRLLLASRTQKYPNAVLPELNGGRWLIVAEAPGKEEEEGGRPLIGPTGRMTDNFLQAIKLPRQNFDLTNVVLWRPPNNRLEVWIDEEDERVSEGVALLAEHLSRCKYDAVLALGWFALLALTGRDGIREHRGSIYRLEDGTPVLGTYHPAYLFHEPKLANVVFRDLFRFKEMVTNGVPQPPKRDLLLFPREEEAVAWASHGGTGWLAVDIEADPETKKLTEVGFAWSSTDAMTVKMGETWTWPFVRELLATANDKVFHNAPFDVPFLRYTLGWNVEGEIHDTLLMHHTLYPEFPADLAFCTSIYTNQPYYKSLGASSDEHERQLYNALDVACTAEIYPLLEKKLRAVGLYETYDRDRSVLPQAMDMSLRGVRYDAVEHRRLLERTAKQLSRWQKVLDLRSGEEINAFSHPKVCRLLYEKLGLPPQYERDKRSNTKHLTTKQTKLLNLYPNIVDRKAQRVVRALLKVRELRKFRSSYLKSDDNLNSLLAGADGRMRTSFGVARTETGRWTASTFLIDMEGTNLQTVPPAWKSCFIADEEKMLFSADYSQIEARLVAYDAEDLEQIRVFESGGDIHTENAARLLRKPLAEVTKHERQYVGKSVHALNYDVGPDTLAEFANKKGLESGVFISQAFARRAKQLYLSTYDKVIKWQRRQWETVREKRILTNFLGRRRIFTGPTKGEFAHITRGEAIAFVPQSTVPDMLNIAMLRIRNDAIMRSCGVVLLLQVHDALIGQGDANKVAVWAPRLKELMTVPLTIHGRPCIVPTDVKVGKRWSKMEEVK